MTLILEIFLFNLGKLIISLKYLKTFNLYFKNKKGENQKSFHKVKHLNHKNQLKNYDLLLKSFLDSYIF